MASRHEVNHTLKIIYNPNDKISLSVEDISFIKTWIGRAGYKITYINVIDKKGF